MANNSVEFCAGCGREAPAYPAPGYHPWGGVARDEENQGWMVLPVCDTCYMHPDSRSYTIKAHFFVRDDAETRAVKQAGSPNLGG